ncbi:MAG: serine hydroxymethyltransferase [Proteobacteria bacterium]|nr:serine hydroxymethyltransferase [Pseudomonadota bacterium]
MNNMTDFFTANLEQNDPEIAKAIHDELVRQQDQIEMIASENIVSSAVLEAQGSVLTNKYAEGYSGRRYYGGCEYVDVVETLAIERAKKLFNCNFVNVQPHSGAQANQAVFLALLQPGDTVLGMSLEAGGHLTHGAGPNLSGKWFNAVQYGVSRETGQIDYDALEARAIECQPKLIVAGASAYPRQLDFAAFQTLRAARGGLILTNDEALGRKINSAVFPGLQGGPLMHAIAGKAVAFGEALKPEFKTYIETVVKNAQILGEVLLDRGLDLVSGGTDTHLVLVDLRPKGLTGDITEVSLENAGITCNKNGVPFDPEKPMVTSGIRLGTPAGTTRGFGPEQFTQIGHMIGDVLDGLASNRNDNSDIEMAVRAKVRDLCRAYPIY